MWKYVKVYRDSRYIWGLGFGVVGFPSQLQGVGNPLKPLLPPFSPPPPSPPPNAHQCPTIPNVVCEESLCSSGRGGCAIAFTITEYRGCRILGLGLRVRFGDFIPIRFLEGTLLLRHCRLMKFKLLLYLVIMRAALCNIIGVI